MQADAKQRTHYEALELPNRSCTSIDIKKSYRRLAVLHHPDRNIGNEEEATVKFREINEAYEVLSDESSRRQYDQSLKYGGGGASSHSAGPDRYRRRQDSNRYRDPFEQFNNVFRTDPFFADAFKGMDDLFDKHFSDSGRGRNLNAQQQGANAQRTTKVGGFGTQYQSYSSSTVNGQMSHTSQSYGGGNRNTGRRSAGSSSYTSKSTRTVVQNGKRVTIQSLEKDGNRIEEKYVDNRLIARTINGVPEKVERIGRGESLL